MFSVSIGVWDSNEAEVMAILGALRIFSRSFKGSLIVESDLSNVVHGLLIIIRNHGDCSFVLMR